MPPAARVSDQTAHGTPLAPGPGSMDVMIGGMPAWRAQMDQHACPAVNISGADGVGMVQVGSVGVFINGMMACRQLDIVIETPGLAMGPINPIILGFPTVIIGDMGAGAMAAIAAAVNPTNSGINCGNIIDAVIDRLTGKNPNAVAPTTQDGSWDEIEKRHNIKIQWGQSFQKAFDAVKAGGDGTVAIVGINYSDGNTAHVVTMTNDHGTVGIIEGQDWGTGQPQGFNTSPADANKRYNSDGGSDIGYGIVRTGR